MVVAVGAVTGVMVGSPREHDTDVVALHSNASVLLLSSFAELLDSMITSWSSEQGILIASGSSPDKHSSSKLKSNSYKSNITKHLFYVQFIHM